MAFNAGAVVGKAFLDTQQWIQGTKGLIKSNSAINKSIKGLTTGVKIAGAAIAAGLTASVIKANEFNKAFSNVRTLVDEATVNTKKMRKELLGLDSRLGSAKDLTEGLYQALSASIEPAKAVEFVGKAAKFAKAALVDANTAVDVITTGLNAYKLEAEDAGRISDVLFQTIKKGKVTGRELSASIGTVIPTAAKMNIQIEELGASIAVMTKQGIKSANATTQLNALFSAFLQPSKDMTDAFEEMGIESGSALIEAEGLTGALNFLEEASGGNAEEMAKLLPNMRAFKGALALTGKQSEEFTEILKEMQDSSGSTDEAFQKQELTFETMKNSIGKVAIIVGNRLLPKVYEITTAFTDFISSGETLDALMGTLEVGLTLFNDVWNVIKDGALSIIENLQTSLDEAFGQGTIDNFQLLAGGAKLLGIAFQIVIDGINLVITGIINLVKSIIESGETINAFFEFLTGDATWDEVKIKAEDAGEAFKKFGLDIWNDTNNLVENAVEKFKEFPTEVEASAILLRKKFKKGVTSNGGLSGPIVDELENAGKETEDITEETSDNVLTKWSETIDKMKIKWKEWKEAGKESSKALTEGLQKFASKFSFIVGQLAGAFNSISGIVEKGLNQELDLIKQQNAEKLEILEEEKANKLEKVNEDFDTRMEALQEQRDMEVISEEEFNAQKTALEKQKANETAAIEKALDDKIAEQKKQARTKENAKEKEIFEAKKANQIANVWIQAAVGIVAAWAQSIAQLGPIAGAIFAGVLTAAILGVAIAETVVISQQKFVPAKEKGGMAGGLTRVHEAGGEVITLPDGSQVIPNDISRQIAKNSGGGNGTTINISFAGAKIADDMDLRKVTDFVINKLNKQIKFAQ